ncbi:MAG TPA: nuclear transport factor 2 family protein [Anaerolineales bacterium]
MAIKRNANFRTFLISSLLIAVTTTASCTPVPPANGRPPLDADGMKTYAVIFDQVAAALIQAWNRRTPDLMSPYIRGDIIHQRYNDESALDDDSRLSLLNRSFLANPDYEARLSNTFIGRHDGFIVNESWNWQPVITGANWTEDHPLTEYHWIGFDEGKISDWWLMYARELHAAIGRPLDQTLLQDYAAAWSSGDAEVVANLYTPNGARRDALLEENQWGNAAVKEFAAKFFAWYPHVSLDLLQSFGELPAGTKIGAVYAIHVANRTGRPCDIRALILFEPDGQKIATEWVFYQAQSLLDCGWAR